jgi:hypothetical protein
MKEKKGGSLLQDVRQFVVSDHVEWDGKSLSPRTAKDVHQASVLVAR